jgi:hypothetical protein
MQELNGSTLPPAYGLFGRGGEIRRRRIDGDRALTPVREQLERQCANARTHIEKHALDPACFAKQVSQQTRCRSGARPPIVLQFTSGSLFVELGNRDIAVG